MNKKNKKIKINLSFSFDIWKSISSINSLWNPVSTTIKHTIITKIIILSLLIIINIIYTH